MPIRTNLMDRLELAYPIIQAPMAGGGDTPELVAAVSAAGGIGFMGATYLDPAGISGAAGAVRDATNRPFGINLFAPQPEPQIPDDPAPAVDQVKPYYAELGLEEPSVAANPGDPFEANLPAALQCGASVFSFTMGLLPPGAVQAIKEQGMFLLGTATTVNEAVALEKSGVDAIVAQGSEAGGHRGTFATTLATDFGGGLVGTMALVPQVVDAVNVPVVASGGIMDGRGIAAALALGADAVQMGTAFLTCAEAGIPDAHKDAILKATEDETRVTRAFSGRPARGIVNRFMDEVEAAGGAAAILPFPVQNALTRTLRAEAGKKGRAEFLSLWAGQGLRMSRRGPASDLVAELAGQAEETLSHLAG